MHISALLNRFVWFFTRFGLRWLFIAVVTSLLVWLLMEVLFAFLDFGEEGFSTVRLLTRQQVDSGFRAWYVLRHGVPVFLAVLVFLSHFF